MTHLPKLTTSNPNEIVACGNVTKVNTVKEGYPTMDIVKRVEKVSEKMVRGKKCHIDL